MATSDLGRRREHEREDRIVGYRLHSKRSGPPVRVRRLHLNACGQLFTPINSTNRSDPPPPPPPMDRDGRPGWLPKLGFAFLSFNCGMAIYRSWPDPYSVAFVVVAYVALLLLFHCLHLLERARQGPWLKPAVWGLSTLLTLMFSSKVAAIMPLWAQLLVWAMAIFTIAAGFYAFFLARPRPEERP